MKTIDDALELRGRIPGAFEMAEREPDTVSRRRFLTFVVVGAGPTGVELAGQLAELSRHSLRHNFRHIDPAEARIVLLDAALTFLGAFPDPSDGGHSVPASIGIEIDLGVAATHVDERGPGYECYRCATAPHRSGNQIWAAGLAPSPLQRLLVPAAGAD